MLTAGTEVSCHNLDDPTYQCRGCNAIMWYGESVNKGNKDANPTFSLCCQQGKVLLPRFNEAPVPLNRLLDYSRLVTSSFRDQIRVYNGMFCFTSFRATIDHSINISRGLYTFHINGQNYHRIRSLLPKESTQPRNNSREPDQNVGSDSAIAKSFRMARDWCHSHVYVNMELRLLYERTSSRQYNAPTVAEVAALITNDFRAGEPTRDIIVNKKDSRPKRILQLHLSYMALQYPLLFPYREDGDHDKIFGGRLYQQYLVDAYTAIEEQRLSWMRNNQGTLRVDLYHNMCDAVTRGDTNAAGLGKRIVLLHTFTDSPRYMMQNYQDAMALCRAYGNPDLFITFTSNPKWPKISKMLAYIPRQRAHNHPETHGDIDDIILAELPSPMDDPEGHKSVTDYMLHGPYGKGAACNIEGKCSKHFPKEFCTERINQDGYPIYRRRDNKVCVKKGGTGKTFLYKTIISRLRLEWKIVLAVASSDYILAPTSWKDCSQQILPVIPKGKRANIVQACINRSLVWKHCKIVAEMYPNFIERQRDDAYLREGAILTPRNDDADAINAYMFDKLEGENPNRVKRGRHSNYTHDHIDFDAAKMAVCPETMTVLGQAMLCNDD
ncbi:DNA helicase PIF1, ATP-dependent [Tanacetum coccineum]